MAKFTSFNRTNLPQVRNLIQAKLDELEKETGIKVDLGSIKFSDYSFRASINAQIISDVNNKAESMREIWNRECYLVGLAPEDFKEKFITPDGTTMTFVRFDFKKRKYPIITTNGVQQFKMSAGQYRSGRSI